MASIEDYIDSINYSIETIDRNNEEIKDADLPSDFKLLFGTTHPDSKLLQFIFDTKLDKTIDNVLSRFLNGDFSAIDKYTSLINKVFETVGIGSGAFKGEVSQTLMNNILHSLNSIDMKRTESKLSAAMLLVRNLKRQKKYIDDPVTRKKYAEAVRSLKKLIEFISKVYKDRRIISNRVVAGLKMAVNEEFDYYSEFEYKLLNE